jgi:hypothetical protein
LNTRPTHRVTVERGREAQRRRWWFGLASIFLSVTILAAGADSRWWKGNLHTHTLWSDGDDFPEMVVAWYKAHGYHFLGLSDHNVFQEGDYWIPITNSVSRSALAKYSARFGRDWVKTQFIENTQWVQLKTLSACRSLYEEPNQFLMLPSEEITTQARQLPVHIVASNLRTLISPSAGTNVLDVIQRNIDRVNEQRRRTGQPMFPHIAHPNYGWAITAEDLMRVRGDKFFEIYNGHSQVANYGDTNRPSAERMWDLVLTERLAVLDLEPLFGLAVDDSHNYHAQGLTKNNPGRGWVMVRAPALDAAALIAAMEAGDFYASTGVRLQDVRRSGDELAVAIEPESGVQYLTRFIGTRRGFDPQSEPVPVSPTNAPPASRRYSKEVGAVFLEVLGTEARYALRGDEIYVRAKVISTKRQDNPFAGGDFECAWTQPLLPGTK